MGISIEECCFGGVALCEHCYWLYRNWRERWSRAFMRTFGGRYRDSIGPRQLQRQRLLEYLQPSYDAALKVALQLARKSEVIELEVNGNFNGKRIVYVDVKSFKKLGKLFIYLLPS